MTRRPLHRILAAGLALALLGAAACSDDDGGDDDTSATTAADGGGEAGETTGTLSDDDALAAATTYADVVFAAYAANVTAATEMGDAIDAFVAAPSDATLQAAKDAWRAGRELYGPTEVFRFYDGPIDEPEAGPEGQINAWPLDEAYVDYVEDDPGAGLVADAETLPEITGETIAAVNEEGGETNVSTGWHAIEFLLWGQDLSEDGPGARPVTDYTTDPSAARRGQYLAALADLLVDDLTSVRDQWDPEGGAYREEFLSDPHQAVTNILRGMGALSAGELAGERILVAYDTQDQEDEHSCFSDNTLVDIVGNARGIQIAYTGEYEGVEGTSLSDVVAEIDPERDAALTEALDANVAAAEALDELGTFDQLIVGDDEAEGRAAVRTLAEDLQGQGDLIAELAGALGYEISLEI
ncbi:iron-regulated protein [Iamia sp. SCSIO 61187]|uniref:imelysin family protein n=1 Tax=Iamia sp. SCSIO 61187 TaxID=2722752 RepID=UPI001C627B13|nr:imelysin family protein [Iamia sp. SCSIO 61187]QYG92179.1 iron-regulated protein [Iamia sp. SCSIO 61187]